MDRVDDVPAAASSTGDGLPAAPRSSGEDEPLTDGAAPLGSSATGDEAVDAALGRLAEVERLDVREHAGVFAAVHEALQDRLAEAEQ